MHPQGLTPYLDDQGALRFWPSQESDRIAVLCYLADQFAPGQQYSEKAVNALLARYVARHVRDHVSVRRDLIDERLLQRSGDGARYWRSDETARPPTRQLSDEEAYARYWGGAPTETD